MYDLSFHARPHDPKGLSMLAVAVPANSASGRLTGLARGTIMAIAKS